MITAFYYVFREIIANSKHFFVVVSKRFPIHLVMCLKKKVIMGLTCCTTWKEEIGLSNIRGKTEGQCLVAA